jgi:hypothetical protein
MLENISAISDVNYHLAFESKIWTSSLLDSAGHFSSG